MFGITKQDWKQGLRIFVPKLEMSWLGDFLSSGKEALVALFCAILGLSVRLICWCLFPLGWLFGAWLIKIDRLKHEEWKRAHGFTSRHE